MRTTLLSQRVEVALLDPSLATLTDRDAGVQLTERFWKEDNPNTLKEPPSIAYEIMEVLIKKTKEMKTRFPNFDSLLLAVLLPSLAKGYDWRIKKTYQDKGGDWRALVINEFDAEYAHTISSEDIFLFLANNPA